MTWQITVPARKRRETMDFEEVGLMVFTRLNEAQAETSDGQSGSSSDTQGLRELRRERDYNHVDMQSGLPYLIATFLLGLHVLCYDNEFRE